MSAAGLSARDRSEPGELCPGVRFLFTGRGGGASCGPFASLNLSWRVGDDPAAVLRNRASVLHDLGPGPRRLAWMRQVHGTIVIMAGDHAAEPEADATFTGSPELAVGALAADCAPVLIADPVARLVGAAHAGRPGMAAGVVPALVTAMTKAGAEPARMHAMVGPAICGQCYEVPAGLRAEVAAAVPASACQTRTGTPGIDLRAGLHAQLAGLGVRQVRDDARCTAESDDLFSYRRDGLTGRFAGLIWLTP